MAAHSVQKNPLSVCHREQNDLDLSASSTDKYVNLPGAVLNIELLF